MNHKNRTCKNCLLHEKVYNVSIDENGLCNYCSGYTKHKPHGENKLLHIFEKAKKKNRSYDALVPISGGKDSTYVLYLAVKKYKLNVLTYTIDNGFMSELALQNIENAVKSCGVDHIWFRYDEVLLKKLYRTALVYSGEICGVCGTAIERTMLKISEAYRIPLILLGHSPTEDDSFTPENLYDQVRLKAILKRNPEISKKDIKRFLIYPNLNFLSSYFYTKVGRFGKKVNPLYFIPLLSENEIAQIIKNNMGWSDRDESEYTRHLDCIAEPFTNFVREKRFNYSRRICQLSNMVRVGEITREKAVQIHNDDQNNKTPQNFEIIMKKLNLTESDITQIINIKPNVFDDKVSKANHLFSIIRKVFRKGKH